MRGNDGCTFEECVDAAFHGEVAGTVLIIPVKFNAGIIPTFQVGGYGVVIFKDRAKVSGVVFLDILNAKTIYYKKNIIGSHY